MLAELLVVTPSPRQLVVIDDPLPAGFEPVNTSLSTTSKWLSTALTDAEAADSGGAGYVTAWHRDELRDDRALFFLDRMPAGMYRFRYLAHATTPGAFLAPPARAMEIYAPQVQGRSGVGVINVVAGP